MPQTVAYPGCQCCGGSGSSGSGSGVGPVTVDCCPVPVPRRLYVTFGGGTCADGKSFPIDYVGGDTWEGGDPTACDGLGVGMRIICVDGESGKNWAIKNYKGYCGVRDADSVFLQTNNCQPFMLTDPLVIFSCGLGFASFVITE